MAKCSIEWCARPAQARGYCNTHYARWKKGIDMDIPLPPLKEKSCKAEGCEATNLTSPFSNGYCAKHNGRVRNNGDPNIIVRLPANPIIDGMKVCSRGHQYDPKLKACPECQKPAKQSSSKRRKEKVEAGEFDGKVKVCKKGLHEYDAKLRSCPECYSEKMIANEDIRRSLLGTIKTCRNGLHQYDASLPQCPECESISQSNYRQSPEGRAAIRVKANKRTRIAAQGDLTVEQWIERLEEFEHKCAYCNIQLLTSIDGVEQHHPQYQNIEHIIPLLGGGQHTKNNVVPACHGCNNSKLNRNVWEWMKKKGIEPSKKLLSILQEADRMHQQFLNSSAA